MKFISEGNVYRLICSSHKPDAEMFEKWVFDELLPTIRATGGYVNDPVVFVNEWLPNTDEKSVHYTHRLYKSWDCWSSYRASNSLWTDNC